MPISYAHDDKGANKTAAKIRRLTGRRARDSYRPTCEPVSECERAVEEAAEALDGLDVLVNNAGVVHPAASSIRMRPSTTRSSTST